MMKNLIAVALLFACSAASAKGLGTRLITEVKECPPGTYQSTTAGVTYCTACPVGYYQNASGQASCSSCQAGTYDPVTGSTAAAACLACPAGYYQDTRGQASCTPCPEETYNPFTGSSTAFACFACPGYYYSYPGSAECISCDYNIDPSQDEQCSNGNGNQ